MNRLTSAGWVNDRWQVRYDGDIVREFNSPIDALIDLIMRVMGYIHKEDALFAMGTRGNILYRYRAGAKIPTSWLFHAHEITGISAADLRTISDTKHPSAA